MKGYLGTGILVAIAIACCALLAGAGDEKRVEVPAVEIGSKYVLIGQLGKPLGSFVTIEGTVPQNPRMKVAYPLTVDTVDGVKLTEPVVVETNVKALPATGRCVLRGYESGGMVGEPVREDGKTSGAQAVFHFAVWFKATEVKAPASLKIEG
jgi:hypothetical protein